MTLAQGLRNWSAERLLRARSRGDPTLLDRAGVRQPRCAGRLPSCGHELSGCGALGVAWEKWYREKWY